MGRKSLAEVETRRVDVYDMLLQGKSIGHIVAWCNKNYGVKRSAVEKDIYAVKQEMLKQFTKQKKEVIVEHLARYENIYRIYMDPGTEEEPNIHYDPEKAAKMLEKKEKLLKLYNPEVVINNIDKQLNINLNDYSTEELKNMLDFNEPEQ